MAKFDKEEENKDKVSRRRIEEPREEMKRIDTERVWVMRGLLGVLRVTRWWVVIAALAAYCYPFGALVA
jgi:hypothetical protein